MKVGKNRVLGCAWFVPLAVLLMSGIFGASAYVTGSISKGGAVTLIVAVFCSLMLLVAVSTGRKAGDE